MHKKIFILYFFLATQISFSQTGIIKSYYPNKNIKSEISYINDILDGKSIYYYENGNEKLEQNFSRGILNGWVKEFYENGNLKKEFYVNNGIKDGDEKSYSNEGQLLSILSYQNGIMIKEQKFSEEKFKTIEKIVEKSKDIFKEAYPIGGIEEIQSKIIYPDDAIKYGLEGKVKILLTISETGNILNHKFLKSLGLGCDEEALRVLQQTKFMPARLNDKFVQSELELELTFSLPKKENIISTDIKNENKFVENITIICDADECPKPFDDLQTIYSRIEIPNVAKVLKVKGMIVIEATVNLEGNIIHSKIISGVGYGCDQQVEESLKKSKFTVAKKNGKSIETKFLINFPFSYDFNK